MSASSRTVIDLTKDLKVADVYDDHRWFGRGWSYILTDASDVTEDTLLTPYSYKTIKDYAVTFLTFMTRLTGKRSCQINGVDTVRRTNEDLLYLEWLVYGDDNTSYTYNPQKNENKEVSTSEWVLQQFLQYWCLDIIVQANSRIINSGTTDLQTWKYRLTFKWTNDQMYVEYIKLQLSLLAPTEPSTSVRIAHRHARYRRYVHAQIAEYLKILRLKFIHQNLHSLEIKNILGSEVGTECTSALCRN